MTPCPEKLIDCLAVASDVVLVTHINPDGDALGSLFGLADILAGMGKNVIRYLEEEVSPLYRFLPDCERVVTDLDQVMELAAQAGTGIAVVSVDCGDQQRLGASGPRLLETHPFVVIDHHQGNKGFGDITWIDPQRSSTGEMIYDLAMELNQTLSQGAAICLYTALVTDTGSFRYDATTGHTLKVAGALVDAGVRPEVIAGYLYDNYSLGRLRLLQMVLATLEIYAGDRIGVVRVTRHMLEKTGTTLEDTENFINMVRAVRTVEVAVFLKEGGSFVSVSMRAKGGCDVAAIAARFGGGGHRNASGFRLQDEDIDHVRDMLVAAISQALPDPVIRSI